MRNDFLSLGVFATFRPTASITMTIAVVLSIAPACLSQTIKKKTELILPQDRLAFEVAEGKKEAGRGNGTGTAILRGLAAGPGWHGVEMPGSPDTSDPNWNYNTDSTQPVNIAAGRRCRARLRDKAVVLGTDEHRLLIEISREHFIYTGPQEGPALLPASTGGSLTFSEIADTPACLNKMKVWVDHDVFLALQGLPAVTPKGKRKKKGDSEEGKEAVRRAVGSFVAK